jgi:hypothetical protein
MIEFEKVLGRFQVDVGVLWKIEIRGLWWIEGGSAIEIVGNDCKYFLN